MEFEESDAIKITIQNSSIVYFLLDKREVVYVGKSTVGVGRINQHTDKQFDEAYIIPCHASDIDVYEDTFIWKYKPKYNKKPNDNESCSLKKLKQTIKRDYPELAVTLRDIKEAVVETEAEVGLFNGIAYLHGCDIAVVTDYVVEKLGGYE